MSLNVRAAGRQAFGATVIVCLFFAGAALAAESASPLPLRSGDSFDWWGTALKAMLVAVACLAVVAVALYRFKNRSWTMVGGTPAAAVANVEWARRVSPRTTLIVVKWQGKRYLLAENTATTELIDTQAAEGSQP